MATLASAPEATASKSSVREITHWINGAPVARHLRPLRRRLPPRHRHRAGPRPARH